MNLFVSLKYLVALDDHRHFGRAALACHVTQPALSNALRALEESYGTAIVKRGRQFGGFTAEGERILQSARRMLREQELLEQDLHSSADRPRGHLHIGAVPTAMPIAARFAAQLQERHPGIVPIARSMSSVELESRLEGLALDLGFGYTERLAHGRAALRLIPQYPEHYYLLRRAAGRRASTLRIGAPMAWAEAAGFPLCLLSAEMHNRSIVDRAFAAAGAQPHIAMETNSIMALTLGVAAGRLCSIVPGSVVGAALGHAGLEARPLVAPQVAVPIALIVHDTHQPSRTLQAALALAADPDWHADLARHAGLIE